MVAKRGFLFKVRASSVLFHLRSCFAHRMLLWVLVIVLTVVMLGFLRGNVLAAGAHFVILENGGLGYKIMLPMSILLSLVPGSQAQFYLHAHIREDGHDLFGFSSFDELELAEQLLTVSGIGPKTAQTIVGLGPDKVREAIRGGDVSLFLSVSGIGKKRAQQVVLDLKGTIDVQHLDAATKSDDVVLALQGLGYNGKEIMEIMRRVPKEGATEDRLREALGLLGNV